jgi:hypothetical protein
MRSGQAWVLAFLALPPFPKDWLTSDKSTYLIDDESLTYYYDVVNIFDDIVLSQIIGIFGLQESLLCRIGIYD